MYVHIYTLLGAVASASSPYRPRITSALQYQCRVYLAYLAACYYPYTTTQPQTATNTYYMHIIYNVITVLFAVALYIIVTVMIGLMY